MYAGVLAAECAPSCSSSSPAIAQPNDEAEGGHAYVIFARRDELCAHSALTATCSGIRQFSKTSIFEGLDGVLRSMPCGASSGRRAVIFALPGGEATPWK
jgi:hypothetical protein